MAYTTINKSGDFFNTLLYTATGTQSVTGAGFQPDMSWVKARSTTSGHNIADAVRGSTKTLRTDTNAAEGTQNLITSFDSDGVSLGSANWSDSRTAVIWNWLGANGTASNTDGSISSTVSVNTTSGFSIVSYTGTGANATVGHGLGSNASMVIIKNRDSANNWFVHHKDLGGVACLNLDTTDASFSPGTPAFQNPPLTSSLIQLATNVSVNNSGQNYIAYCFAEKTGYSKFGSYVGNSSADGTFVYTGFKPAFVLVKNTSAAQSWWMWDNKRAGANGLNYRLRPDQTTAETADNKVDLVSNGFKFRDGDNAWNYSGNTFIYMAFGQSLVGSNNIPATAR